MCSSFDFTSGVDGETKVDGRVGDEVEALAGEEGGDCLDVDGVGVLGGDKSKSNGSSSFLFSSFDGFVVDFFDIANAASSASRSRNSSAVSKQRSTSS